MPGVADTSNPTPTTATLRYSTLYLAHVFKTRATPADAVREFYGVLVHELVHAYQGNGNGTAPWAWIEGVADWVRLRAGLPAMHWRRKVEREVGWREVVQEMNRRLIMDEWRGEDMWVEQTGREACELWGEYCAYFGAMREEGGPEA
ncbi:hypothetical protein BCR44DRAFT_1437337 [Catenaria anguillulae PL171]|uniref:Uncharacterized protein n=1 Tax=Catenaria anguillulae PL171 TaxID=765915 RepID=A0A1Y2HH96_9FUNG|nr:hypothetical protein BCR44DRAFT_1437337 [Catenaria anguillulae PL171]